MENTIKLKYIWGILLLALHFVFVKGQPICVARQYTVRDGLIQSNPAQILQLVLMVFIRVLHAKVEMRLML